MAKEVRVFPLLALGGLPSAFVETCAALLRETGYDGFEIELGPD